MGFIDRIIPSVRKSKQLHELSVTLGSLPSNGEFTEGLQATGPSRKQQALGDLIDLCESDPRLAPILRKYGATRATLEELYTMLLSSGAGQWVRAHFVAASALAFPTTLDYLLRMRRDDLKDLDSVQEVTFRLLQYFGNGEVGPIG